jgi:hypothetical protein
MFEGIKKMCAVTSEEMAREYAKTKREEFIDKENKKNQEIMAYLKNRIKALSKKYEIYVTKGPTTSSVQKPNGEWMDFRGFVQNFSKEAPILTEFINEVGGMLEVDPEAGKISVFELQITSPSDFCSAEYFISSEDIYALNLANGEIFKFRGRQTSAVTQASDEKTIMSLNLEHEPSMEDLIYEIVRAKWPEQLPEQKISYQLVDHISDKIKEQLNLSAENPILEIDTLKRERSEILDAFHAFDEDLTACLRGFGIS